MNPKHPSLLLVISLLVNTLCAQAGQLSGRILDEAGVPLGYAHAFLRTTSWGATTNDNGVFVLQGIPGGSYELVVSALGFLPHTSRITLLPGRITDLGDLRLTPIPLDLNAVVITGTRTGKRRLNNPVAVSLINAQTLQQSGAQNLAQSLNYSPGLRLETDCQTCGYTQLRMNGLPGNYTQILINSRPIFGPLLSLYGLEQLPVNMIERVEIVRGGGSVLFGPAAIAGTVNVITRDPQASGFQLGTQTTHIGAQAWESSLQGNVTWVADDQHSGVSLFGSRQRRDAYDANGDGFSELPLLSGSTLGMKGFYEPSTESRLELNLWQVQEHRRGGNRLSEIASKADQAEERWHDIFAGGLDYQLNLTPNTELQAYAAGQNTRRIHYTGVDQADGWGHTRSHTLISGVQLNHQLDHFPAGANVLTLGTEWQRDFTDDRIEGYGFYLRQRITQQGLFLQSDWQVGRDWQFVAGGRLNWHSEINRAIFTPRLNIFWRQPGQSFQFRAGYAQGVKGPQVFETDLHIAFAGGGISRIQVDPLLREEISHSLQSSLDWALAGPHLYAGFTLNGFQTRLLDAFVLQNNGYNDQGNLQLLRTNGADALVRGLTFETRWNFDDALQIEGAYTWQTSRYNTAVAWSETAPPIRNFLRTPNHYGYLTFALWPQKPWQASITGNTTGPMWVPHLAGAPEAPIDELERTPFFVEIGIQLVRQITLPRLGLLEVSTGIQNAGNAFQQDFDSGKNRDSNYFYGPARPRSFYVRLTLRSLEN